MSIKYYKVYEYEFGIDLEDILKDVFAVTGKRHVSAERDGDTLKICFEEELSSPSEDKLRQLIGRKIPHFIIKKKKTKYINLQGEEIGGDMK